MVEVKGALPVDKAALKEHARHDAPAKTTKAADTAEAKTTKPAKQAAAKEQFDKADEAAADDTRLRMAALGGL